MGYHHDGPFTDLFGAVGLILGTLGQLFIGRKLRIPPLWNYGIAIVLGLIYFVLTQQIVPKDSCFPPHILRQVIGACGLLYYVICAAAGYLVLLRDLVPVFRSERRKFLKVSTAAVCAAPAAVLGFGVITRKDFIINEVPLSIPHLPKDLNGLRILQISDIHFGPFFGAGDLRRVVDASNALRPEFTVVTGDLITDEYDPLDECLKELARLKAPSGVWGCMGNHEMYSHVQAYTELKAKQYGITFLRQQARMLRFGNSKLNLAGVDYNTSGESYAAIAAPLLSPGDFNLLLAHTPEAFPDAAHVGYDLTLSGHTHGGQINLPVFGNNLNVVDLHTPYTKGLYQRRNSLVYVNSGLGTIGVPARLGAPAEITLIRLCNS